MREAAKLALAHRGDLGLLVFDLGPPDSRGIASLIDARRARLHLRAAAHALERELSDAARATRIAIDERTKRRRRACARGSRRRRSSRAASSP